MLKVLLLILFCSLANPSWAAYLYYRAIVVDHNKVSTNDQTQFPILVCANGSAPCASSVSGMNQTGGGAHVQNSNGYDIIFTTDKVCTTKLTWEMESYNASTGEFEAWVTNTGTALSHTVDTTFYMCYGNAAISTFQSTASAVWDSNYVGVWHLPNGTTLTASNTVTGVAGTLTGPPTATSGQIDGAANFGGHSNDSIATDISSSSTQRTYSIWTNRTGTGGSGLGRIYDKRNSGGSQVDELYYFSGNATYDFAITFSGAVGEWTIAAPTANSWHYIVVTYNNSSTLNVPIIYLDGTSQTVTVLANPSGTVNTNTNTYVIGNRTNDAARNWAGSLDEFRLANTIRSADWITTEYNSQNNPNNGSGQFYSMGAETSTGHTNLIQGASLIQGVSLIN